MSTLKNIKRSRDQLTECSDCYYFTHHSFTDCVLADDFEFVRGAGREAIDRDLEKVNVKFKYWSIEYI